MLFLNSGSCISSESYRAGRFCAPSNSTVLLSRSACTRHGGECRFPRAVSRGGEGRWAGAGKEHKNAATHCNAASRAYDYSAREVDFVQVQCLRACLPHLNQFNILPSEPMRRHAEWTLQCCSPSLAMPTIIDVSHRKQGAAYIHIHIHMHIHIHIETGRGRGADSCAYMMYTYM